MAKSGPAPTKPGLSGVVLETMDAAEYTYVRVDTTGGEIWAVSKQFPTKVGDTVEINEPMAMPNFPSKTLNRTFELVYFAGSITHKGDRPAMGSATHGMGAMGGMAAQPAPSLDFSGIKKPDNGVTVAELLAQKSTLVGSKVTLRGKVAKATYGVMGKTWLHIQDGTGETGANDVTVTTTATSTVGETVLVEGVLAADKNIGAGYVFPLIVEDARVVSEK
jgi:hypothetical protein